LFGSASNDRCDVLGAPGEKEAGTRFAQLNQLRLKLNKDP